MDKDVRDAVDERTLTPLGWHLVGTSYLDAAEELVGGEIKLRFEDPIRSLFAHAWELNLKACLRKQGHTADAVRLKYGHDLLKIWDAIDRNQFPLLQLRDEVRHYVEHIAFYHRNRFYAYPLRGRRNEHTLQYVRATSSRLRLPREAAIQTFGSL
ncbi:hypothetical protein KCP91_12150 [Microvirga sp. SRT01]|uniref:HEPN domain-containing protein n=1 Tax=Sphingomonas longa TaxID=2778730 RepID=A0ABS2D868_9SPHN|nr:MULTISPECIES: hypothetical protein [Alphaproteobacteria]MBM6577125.1 hypothetical protein [Sphingomonas sp. BT552]MBR7710169.1 hypothetical protein [Microvirga sp. SRT01]